MCRNCLIDVRPDRNRTCLDNGSYLLNFSQCAVCKIRQEININNRITEESDSTDNTDTDTTTAAAAAAAATPSESAPAAVPPSDYEETTTYNHSCSSCSHIISEHYYSFTVTHSHSDTDSIIQEYIMDCVLCGRGSDTSTVLRDIGKSINPTVLINESANGTGLFTTTAGMSSFMMNNSGLATVINQAVATRATIDTDTDEWN